MPHMDTCGYPVTTNSKGSLELGVDSILMREQHILREAIRHRKGTRASRGGKFWEDKYVEKQWKIGLASKACYIDSSGAVSGPVKVQTCLQELTSVLPHSECRRGHLHKCIPCFQATGQEQRAFLISVLSSVQNNPYAKAAIFATFSAVSQL